MADNAFVKIGTALLKHQMKKLVGDETLGVIGEELSEIGGDKLDAWLGERSTQEELEKAAQSAQTCFREKVTDSELQQWMVSLPLGNLPKVVEAIDELPSSPNESKLENALRDSIALTWKKLSPEQVDNAVNSFLSCLRSALLPIEKQTLMVIGRSVLRTEDKVDLLIHWFEQYIITGKSIEIKQLNPEPADSWNLKHPYAMPPNFTGRVEERKMLTDWLNKDNENRLFILRALGGFGKSALSWHWLTHDVDSNDWKKVVFWSFYEGDASFEHFIEETLKYLKLEVPQGGRPQVDALLKAMQSQKILLIMDGFERALRAYSSMNAAYQADDGQWTADDSQFDCVNINAEFFLKGVCSLPNIKGKVLMTTRLTPRAIKPRGEFMLGCREVELTSMQPADAVEFFRKQGIKGTHVEIEAACTPYGYHPLSLRLLAGRILKDFENPADIMVAQKLKIDGDLKAQKHHVLEVSYNSLLPHQQKLLGEIACFRSPVELKTIRSIAEDKETPDDNLQDLRERGFLHFDEKNKKFDLHPIVRRYAYERLTSPVRTTVHASLRDYFAAVAIPDQPRTINDLMPVIELYHHLVQGGQLDEAQDIFYSRLEIIVSHFGAYQTAIELLSVIFLDGWDQPPSLMMETAQAWVLNELANCYSMIGQPQRAIRLYEQKNEIHNVLGDTRNLSVGMWNIAYQQLALGKIKDAWLNFNKAKEFATGKLDIAMCYRELGRVLIHTGEWEGSRRFLQLALNTFTAEAINLISIYVYLASLDLSQARCEKNAEVSQHDDALKCSYHALKLTNERNTTKRDFVEAYWSLGASLLTNRELKQAEKHLLDALNVCRAINNVESESDILLDLARLRYDQKNYEEAKSLADEALLITERCGYVLQGADVNLFLAQYALEQVKDKAKAKGYAEEALKLATCDGPPYYYKVAYEEAERFLAQLKG